MLRDIACGVTHMDAGTTLLLPPIQGSLYVERPSYPARFKERQLSDSISNFIGIVSGLWIRILLHLYIVILLLEYMFNLEIHKQIIPFIPGQVSERRTSSQA